MRRTLLTVCTLLIAAHVSACASSSTGSSRPRSERNLITAADVQRANATNALEAVERLRPQFLRQHGTPTIQQPQGAPVVVYLNEQQLGGVGTLRNILAGEIREIRYIDARDATTRWGTGHAGGVILVSTVGR